MLSSGCFSAECLGKSVCQDMWKKAQNYLLNDRLVVDPTTPANLFRLVQQQDPDPLEKSLPFSTFKGKYVAL